MCHLMMNSNEIFHIDLSAHLDSEIENILLLSEMKLSEKF
jgi:hypothetical protein